MVVKMFVFMVDNEAFEEKVIWHLFKIKNYKENSPKDLKNHFFPVIFIFILCT